MHKRAQILLPFFIQLQLYAVVLNAEPPPKYWKKQLSEIEKFQPVFERIGEPLLDSLANEKNNWAIRFTLSPTFGKPRVVRVQQTVWGREAISLRLSGQGGYDLGALEYRKDIPLTETTLLHLRQLIGKLDLQMMASITPLPALDGQHWLLEVVLKGKYYSIHRQSPDSKQAYQSDKTGTLKDFVELCKYLLALGSQAQEPINHNSLQVEIDTF